MPINYNDSLFPTQNLSARSAFFAANAAARQRAAVIAARTPRPRPVPRAQLRELRARRYNNIQGVKKIRMYQPGSWRPRSISKAAVRQMASFYRPFRGKTTSYLNYLFS